MKIGDLLTLRERVMNALCRLLRKLSEELENYRQNTDVLGDAKFFSIFNNS